MSTSLDRREALGVLGARAPGCSSENARTTTMTTPHRTEPRAGRMPAVFAAHGAPILLDDAAWTGELAAWARLLPRPGSVLMVSAHWEARPATLGAASPVPPVSDSTASRSATIARGTPAPALPSSRGR